MKNHEQIKADAMRYAIEGKAAELRSTIAYWDAEAAKPAHRETVAFAEANAQLCRVMLAAVQGAS